MSIASLLTVADPTPPTSPQNEVFAWEHAIAHRTLFGAMGTDLAGADTGLSHFTVMPYGLDPGFKHGGWLLDHGQAHTDFTATLPGVFWFAGFVIERDQVLSINSGQNFVDVDLGDPEQRAWWVFSNYIEHQVAASVLPQELVYPFW